MSDTYEHKRDQGKLRWDLLPLGPIRQVVEVLYWAIEVKGYKEGSWAEVPDARKRYYAAAMRHLTAWWEGERTDAESGKAHLAHALCCLIFLLAKES